MKKLLLTILCTFVTVAAQARHYDLTVQRITTADGLPTNIISRVWQSADGYIWFETRSGLCRYDGYEVRVFEGKSATTPQRTRELKTREARWLREGKGRLSRQDNNGSRQSWQLIPEDIIAYTRADHFHVADVDARTEAVTTYGNGLFLYDKPTGELTHIDNEVIDNPYLTGLFVDKTGCIWVTEDYLGVKCLRMNRLQYRWQPLVAEPAIQDVNYIRCMAAADNGRLWCSNQTSDLFEYNPATGTARHQAKTESRIYAMLSDRWGNQWTGTRGKGLFRNGKPVSNMPSADIFSIKEDAGKGLWVASLGGGIVRLKPDGTITDTLLSAHNCHDLQLDSQGQWWVAAEDSLYIINKVKGHNGNGQQQRFRTKGFRAGFYVCVYQSPTDGTVWAGSIGEGLVNAGTGQQFTTRNGLTSNNVYSIVADSLGRLWVGTEEGLSCLDATTGNVRNHHFSQRQLSNVFSERAAMSLPDGRLLFGTHDGLISIVPTPPDAHHEPPPTRITGLLVNGTAMTDGESLDYNDNNVTIMFSNFQYARMGNVVYQYKLEGADQDWCMPTKEHTAVYRHLPPGHYTFLVRSSDGMDSWGEVSTMAIRISQPWWNTWWAWGLYITIAILLGGMLLRLLFLRRRLDIERQVSAFKMDFYNRIERELRNPVNILQGAAENVQLSGTTKTTMQSLRRGSKRVLKLMDLIQQFNTNNTPKDGEDYDQRFHDIVDAIHADEEEFRELAPPPINNHTIVIMEDDDDSLTHLTDTLNPYFTIIGCQTTADCEAAVTQHQPTIVIIDISDDDKACRELTRRLTSGESDLAVIHLSSYNDGNHELRSLKAGASDYVVKPFSSKVLVEKVRKAIERRAASHGTGSLTGLQNSREDASNMHSPLMTDVKDKKFLNLFQQTLASHIADENFSVEQFAQLMNLGRTQFYKKVKALTGETPVQHLHRARLDYAARLLRESQDTVETIMSKAGFHQPTHFYSSFRKQFGQSPREYRQNVSA